MNPATPTEAGVNSEELFHIVLWRIFERGGSTSIQDIYSAVEENMQKLGYSLSAQGHHSVRRVVNYNSVKNGFLKKYDASSPGWNITAKGMKYIGLTPLKEDGNGVEVGVILEGLEVSTVVKVRLNQGVFRNKLLKYWDNKCAITAVNNSDLLVASHIKPWSISNSIERLDVFNGLLLVSSIDDLFDKGFITFDESGYMLFSARLDPLASSVYGINRTMHLAKIEDKHQTYLEYHRTHVFR